MNAKPRLLLTSAHLLLLVSAHAQTPATPTDGADGVPLYPTVLTYNNPDSQDADLEISGDGSFEDSVSYRIASHHFSRSCINSYCVTSWIFHVVDLQPGTPYYWRIINEDTRGVSSSSRFTTATPPAGMLPMESDSLRTTAIRFEWPATNSSTWHDFEISRSTDFSFGTTTSRFVLGQTVEYCCLTPGARYYWRWKPLASSDWNPAWSFYIDYQWGDVTEDGTVSALDAARILQHTAWIDRMDKGDELRGDVNGSGETNAVDAAYVLARSSGIINCFKAEPGCDNPAPYNFLQEWVNEQAPFVLDGRVEPRE